MNSGSVTARVETWPGKSSSWFLRARSLGAIAVLLMVCLLSGRPFATLARHDGGSAADSLLKVCRIPLPLHRDVGEGAADVAKIVGRQFDAGRPDVLFQAVQLRGAGDRNDPRLLGQQPRERDLCRRCLFARR